MQEHERQKEAGSTGKNEQTIIETGGNDEGITVQEEATRPSVHESMRQDGDCLNSAGEAVTVGTMSSRWQLLVRKLHVQQHAHVLETIRTENVEKERRQTQRAEQSLSKTVFGIGPITKTMPASRMIFPLSPFGISWMVLMTVGLFYTALLTPPVVAFHWLDSVCDQVPTLWADTVFDVLFLADILMTFLTGHLSDGAYNDDWRSVALTYVKGVFWFDVATSVPISFIEHATLAACRKLADSESNVLASPAADGPELRLLRVLKPIRLIKIMRVFKLARLNEMLDTISDICDISPQAGKTMRVMLSLLAVIHILACLWWLWVVLGMTEAEIYEFLDSQPWGSQRGEVGHVHDIHTPAGRFDTYVIACYVVTMTLTTVGYGDISANNTSERIGYVVLFIFGAFVWGTLLAQVGEIHKSSSARTEKRLESIQNVIDFLHENEVPSVLRTRVVQWTRFAETHVSSHLNRRSIITKLPADLRADLVRHLYKPLAMKVSIFEYILNSVMDDELADSFLTSVFELFEYKTFAPNEIIIEFSDPADRMIILVEGKVHCKFEHPRMSFSETDLRRGDYIGDFTLIGDDDWGSSSCFDFQANTTGDKVEIEVSTPTFVIVLELLADAFESVLADASYEVQEAVETYRLQWQKQKTGVRDMDGYEHRQLIAWDVVVRKQLKKSHLDKAGVSTWRVPSMHHAQSFKGLQKDSQNTEKKWMRPSSATDESETSLVEPLPVQPDDDIYSPSGTPPPSVQEQWTSGNHMVPQSLPLQAPAALTGNSSNLDAKHNNQTHPAPRHHHRRESHLDTSGFTPGKDQSSSGLEEQSVQFHIQHNLLHEHERHMHHRSVERHGVHADRSRQDISDQRRSSLQSIFCSSCGAKNLASWQFCVACGQQVMMPLPQHLGTQQASDHFLSARANELADSNKWHREDLSHAASPAHTAVEPGTTYSLRRDPVSNAASALESSRPLPSAQKETSVPLATTQQADRRDSFRSATHVSMDLEDSAMPMEDDREEMDVEQDPCLRLQVGLMEQVAASPRQINLQRKIESTNAKLNEVLARIRKDEDGEHPLPGPRPPSNGPGYHVHGTNFGSWHPDAHANYTAADSRRRRSEAKGRQSVRSIPTERQLEHEQGTARSTREERYDELKADIAGLQGQVESTNAKLDHILRLLSRPD